jgi:hypothetical protein
MSIEITQTCSACPLQYEGTINGHIFYYRGRWGTWRFGIAKELEGENGAVGVAMGFVDGFNRTGDNGDTDPLEAEANIRRCCEEWLKDSEKSPE